MTFQFFLIFSGAATFATIALLTRQPLIIAYIVLGVLALRPARSPSDPRGGTTRFVCWVAALVVFGYIVSVALTKDPTGPLAWLKGT